MDEFISEKAIEKASKAIEANNQSMCLENQGLSDESMDNQIQHLAKKLIESNSKDIWND